jgi:rhodanese-related sulfurtransferase
VALKLKQAGFDVAPLAGGLDRWMALDLPLESRPLESLPIR